MNKDEVLAFKQHELSVSDFVAQENSTSPELRLEQLRTMIATACRLAEPDSEAEAAKADVRARWCFLKERFLASS